MNKRILSLIIFAFLIMVNSLALADDFESLQANLMTGLKDFSKLSDNDKGAILGASGIPQAKDFDFTKIMANIIFSSVGFVAFIYGKKNAFWRPMVIGIVLMGYTYIITQTVIMYLIGMALCTALYFWRE